MTDLTLQEIHTLKARLETRILIIENDIGCLRKLSREVVSKYYKGHTEGRIETLRSWQADVGHTLDMVRSIIEEAENAGKETITHF